MMREVGIGTALDSRFAGGYICFRERYSPPANPDELAYLRNCLNSWRGASFKLVPVNGPHEIYAVLELRPLLFYPGAH
jgi:hypothetical protein